MDRQHTGIFSRRGLLSGFATWAAILVCVVAAIEGIRLWGQSEPTTKSSVIHSFFDVIGTLVAAGFVYLARRVAANRELTLKQAELVAEKQQQQDEKLERDRVEQKRRVDVMWATAMDRGKLVAADRGFAHLNTEPPIMNAYIRLTDAGREMFSDMSDKLGALYRRLCDERGRPLKFDELSEDINKLHGREIAEKICTRVSPPMSQYECLVLAATVAIETAFHMPLEQIKQTMPGMVH